MTSVTVWVAAKPYNCIVQYNSYGDSVMSDIKPAIRGNGSEATI